MQNKIKCVVHCEWADENSSLPTDITIPVNIPETEDILLYLHDMNWPEYIEKLFNAELVDVSWEFIIQSDVIGTLVRR